MELICFLVSFLSSAVGAICGIGGGVVIKPVLDFVQMGSASMINFLSGCTVLSMSLYSVGKAMLNRDGKVDLAIGTPPCPGCHSGWCGRQEAVRYGQCILSQRCHGGRRSGGNPGPDHGGNPAVYGRQK